MFNNKINICSYNLNDNKYKYSLSPLPRGFGQTFGVLFQHVLLEQIKGICSIGFKVIEDGCVTQEPTAIDQSMAQLEANIREIRLLSGNKKQVISSKNKALNFYDKQTKNSFFIGSTKGSKNVQIEILFEEGLGSNKHNKKDYNFISNKFSPVLSCYFDVQDIMLQGSTSNNLLDIYFCLDLAQRDHNKIFKECCLYISQTIGVLFNF